MELNKSFSICYRPFSIKYKSKLPQKSVAIILAIKQVKPRKPLKESAIICIDFMSNL